MIELIRLTRYYGSLAAVNEVSLSVSPGEIFACLGPNGAGKTTTIRMMMGLLLPTSGTVRLGGYDLLAQPLAAKRLCGFVPDRPHVYEKLTGLEFLHFVAGLYELPSAAASARATQLLEMFDLGDWADELIENYSHGMKQRLVMAGALIHEPRILVLDEPMVGLDPRGARLLKRTLRALARRGVTVFMSTHSLEVAEEMADRIGIIDQGRLIALGTLEELRQRAGSSAGADLEAIFLRLTGAEDVLEILPALRA